LPAEQISPAAHAVPHAPQLAVSLCVSTQAALQATRPVAHPVLHAPELQTWLDPHAVAQVPQWAGSDVTSTH
jgi:hypothetical protein